MTGGGSHEERNFEETESYVVAGVFLLFLLLTWILQRILLAAERYTENSAASKEVFEKVVEEFVILGLITFTLLVFEQQIVRICITDYEDDWFLCTDFDGDDHSDDKIDDDDPHRRRVLLSGGNDDECFERGLEPLVSATALHEIHLIVFFIGIFHVLYSASALYISFRVIKRWSVWEKELSPAGDPSLETKENAESLRQSLSAVKAHKGLHATHQQFYKGISKEDYAILRLAFIKSHSLPPTFNFNKYLVDALAEDYPKLIGLSWWLWIAVIIESVLRGVFDYISELAVGIGLIISLTIGTKLRSIILTCIRNYGQKKDVVTDNRLFWFKRPDLIYSSLRLVAFFDSTEIAFVVLSLWEIGTDACVIEDNFPSVIIRMGVLVLTFLHISFNVIPMAVIGIQFAKAQLGTHYRSIIFGETAAKVLNDLRKKVAKNRQEENTGEMTANGEEMKAKSESRTGFGRVMTPVQKAAAATIWKFYSKSRAKRETKG